MTVVPQRLSARFFGKDIRISNNIMRRLNLVLSGAYALQALAIAVLSRPYAAPLQATFLASDTLRSQLTHRPVGAVALHVLASLPMVDFIVAALLILALMHVMQATVGRDKFEAGLRTGSNPLRWASFATVLWLITAGTGLFSGLSDITTWLLTAGLIMAMAFLACGYERRAAAGKRHFAEQPNYGWLTVLCACLPLGVTILSVGLTNVFGNGHVLPVCLYSMLATMAVTIGVLVANRIFLNRRYAAWRNAAYGEMWYFILAFVSVSALCWQAFFATLGAIVR